MTISPEQRKAFEQAVKPAIKWLNDNVHPHTKIVIDCDTAELVEGINIFKTDEYIKD